MKPPPHGYPTMSRASSTPCPRCRQTNGQQPPAAGSIVWSTSPGNLTGSIDNHGMTDRLLDDYGRPRPANYHGEGNTPTWRFDDFFGQLRVTLENGEDWYVTVQAPSHFVGALLRLPETV